MRQLLDSQRHHRRVVHRLDAAAEGVYFAFEPSKHRVDSAEVLLFERGFESLGPEHLSLIVLRFDQPIGEEEEKVACLEPNTILLYPCPEYSPMGNPVEARRSTPPWALRTYCVLCPAFT